MQVAASAIGDVRSCVLLDDPSLLVLEMFDDRIVDAVVSHLDGLILHVRDLPF